MRQKLGRKICVLIASNGHFTFFNSIIKCERSENLINHLKILKEGRQSLGGVDGRSSDFRRKGVNC